MESFQNFARRVLSSGRAQSPEERLEVFRRFPDLPSELRSQILEQAASAFTPRLAIVRIYERDPSYTYINNMTTWTLADEIGGNLVHQACLARTDPLAGLLAATTESRDAALRIMATRDLESPWLQRMGLTRFHFDPASGLVYFPSIPDISEQPVWLAFTLGAEFPNIMVNSVVLGMFLESLPLYGRNPVDHALADLRRRGDRAWRNAFTTAELSNPRMPDTLVVFVDEPLPSSSPPVSVILERIDQLEFIAPEQVRPSDGYRLTREAARIRARFDEVRLAFPDLHLPALVFARLRSSYWSRGPEPDEIQATLLSALLTLI